MEDNVEGQTSLESMIAAVKNERIPGVKTRVVPKDTLAYIIFSSGTSGLPKGLLANLPYL
jgi:acyl-CoA synthetase (AMP-forming)/AMP-acid ligase II